MPIDLALEPEVLGPYLLQFLSEAVLAELLRSSAALRFGSSRSGYIRLLIPPPFPDFDPQGRGGIKSKGGLTFQKVLKSQKKSRLRREKPSFLAFSERLAALCTKKIAPAARIFYFSDFLSQLTRSWDPPGKGGD